MGLTMQNNDTVFALAQQSLLASHALETRHLEQMFSKMLANKVDYADLYFQYSRAESWSLEEGIVKALV
jgi:TldD protein